MKPNRINVAAVPISNSKTEEIGKNILQFPLMPFVLMVNPPDFPAYKPMGRYKKKYAKWPEKGFFDPDNKYQKMLRTPSRPGPLEKGDQPTIQAGNEVLLTAHALAPERQ